MSGEFMGRIFGVLEIAAIKLGAKPPGEQRRTIRTLTPDELDERVLRLFDEEGVVTRRNNPLHSPGVVGGSEVIYPELPSKQEPESK